MPAGRMLVADPIRRTVGEAIMLSSDINGIFFFFFFFLPQSVREGVCNYATASYMTI